MNKEEIYISLNDCQHRHLYRIRSRNIRYGVYNEETRSFFGIRTKFGQRFIDDEYHWDAERDGQTNFGTAKPREDLNQSLPDSIGFNDEKKLFEWIEANEPR